MTQTPSPSGTPIQDNPFTRVPTIEILGVPVHSLTMDQAVDLVIDTAQDRGPSPPASFTQFAFVNADCLNIAYNNAPYHSMLNRVPWVLGDGSGVRKASQMLGREIADNVNGTDLFPLLCQRAAAEDIPIYLLGARPGVTDTMKEKLTARFPGLNIIGHHHGYLDAESEPRILHEIATSGARMLFVAFGAPRQDMWIDQHQNELGDVRLAMGVGGLFDFMSERIPRAPKWMRKSGIEWVYRLVQEPGRMWRRYIIGNPLFLWRVRQQIKGTSDPS